MPSRLSHFFKPALTGFLLSLSLCAAGQNSFRVPDEFVKPPHEFSVMPFWFWNDELKDEEIIRQLDDFEAHGVYGFVIHPRIGLPKDSGWMSPRLLQAMHLAVNEAAKRGMHVILYDEGMYPSGSASGEVVAKNPAHAARGLALVEIKEGESPALKEGWKLLATLSRPGGQRYAVVDRPTGGVIRGLHYLNEGEKGRLKEFTPPAGDILNPEAVASFIHLVYDRYAQEFGADFGKTVIGIFTDEPNPLGRDVRDMVAGNAAVLDQVSKILGYDFRPHLLDLWFQDNPDSKVRRIAYRRAVNECLEQSYYSQLSAWCVAHKVALTGHPAESTDIGTERHFQIPGQDLVWRYVEPGPKALQGADSTMAKCASSAMVHLGRSRNLNEIYGAYGHNLTFDEVNWLANWCFVRGQNMLVPHAFYYSVRGPRWDERPPDVGPHSSWWPDFKPYADSCSRLCWLNTDSRAVCDIAILVDSVSLPWNAAKILFENQRDFNYLEFRHLWEHAQVDEQGLHIAGMTYTTLLIEDLESLPAQALPSVKALAKQGRVVCFGDKTPKLDGAAVTHDAASLLSALQKTSPASVVFSPAAPGLRVRQVLKGGLYYAMLFNEESTPIEGGLSGLPKGQCALLDLKTGAASAFSPEKLKLAPHEIILLCVRPAE
jgi:hypothetical protein